MVHESIICMYLDWGNGPVVDAFSASKPRMELCLQDQNVNERYKQATQIKIALGEKGMRSILASGLSDDDKKDPSTVYAVNEE